MNVVFIFYSLDIPRMHKHKTNSRLIQNPVWKIKKVSAVNTQLMLHKWNFLEDEKLSLISILLKIIIKDDTLAWLQLVLKVFLITFSYFMIFSTSSYCLKLFGEILRSFFIGLVQGWFFPSSFGVEQLFSGPRYSHRISTHF